MSEIKVNYSGVQISINTGDSIDDIKKKLAGEHMALLFEGVDTNNSGKIDTDAELDTFKRNLAKYEYKVEGEEPAAEKKEAPAVEQNEEQRASTRQYNSTIQNMKNRYDAASLKNNFDSADDKTHTVQTGDTLWKIAKQALTDEGLNVTSKAINDRIAQIAAINKGLNDVNNIPTGTKLIVRLTGDAVTTVKANETQNSAEVFGGARRTQQPAQGAGQQQVQVAGQQQVQVAGQQQAQGAGQAPKTKKPEVKPSAQAEVKSVVTPSAINVSKVDLDGYAWEDVSINEFSPELGDNDNVYKGTKGEGDDAKVIYKLGYNDGFTVYANSPEDLKAKHTEVKAALDAIKDVPELTENSTEEEKQAAAKIQSDNKDAVYKLIEHTNGEIGAITYIIDNYLDKLSKEDRSALLTELLKTKNAEVVRAVLYNPGENARDVDAHRLNEDKTSAETLIALRNEITAKERQGVKLTDEEVELKEVLKLYQYTNIFTIPADGDKCEKQVRYDDGEVYYYTNEAGGVWASSQETLDAFVADYKAAVAETDDTKKQEALQAVFAKYADTDDAELAKCMLANTTAYNAKTEDIVKIINKFDMFVLQDLQVVDNLEGDNKTIAEAMVKRITALYTSENSPLKGDVTNLKYLDDAFAWIDKLGDTTEGEGENAVTTTAAERKQAILDSYFSKEETTVLGEDDKPLMVDGKEVKQFVYTFTPNRRPTIEEMEKLAEKIYNEWQNAESNSPEEKDWENRFKALVDTIKVEDMGKGQFPAALEAITGDAGEHFRYIVQTRYEELVNDIQTPEEAVDFVGKIQNCIDQMTPFNKIIEKFPESDEVKVKLLQTITVDSTISQQNKVTLLSGCFKTEGENVTFDASKLPEGVSVGNVLSAIGNYKKGAEADKDAEATLTKYVEAILKTFGTGDYGKIRFLADNTVQANVGPMRNRLAELVEAEFQKTENVNEDFLKQVLGGNTDIIPWDKFKGHEAYIGQSLNAETDENKRNRVINILLNDVYKTADERVALLGRNEKLTNRIIKEAVPRKKDGSDETIPGIVSQPLYDAMVAQGLVQEMGDGYVMIPTLNKFYEVVKTDGKVSELKPVKEMQIATNMYKNIYGDGNFGDNKAIQKNYVKALGEMSPLTVAQVIYDSKDMKDVDSGYKDGFFEALDWEQDGANLEDMMKLIFKVVEYAKDKPAAAEPLAKLLNAVNTYRSNYSDEELMTLPEGQESITADNIGQVQFTDIARERDFTPTGMAGFFANIFTNPAKDFDKLVMDVINATVSN